MTSISLNTLKNYKVDYTPNNKINIFRKAPTDLSLYIMTYLDGNDRNSLKATGRFEHYLFKKEFKNDLVQIKRFTQCPNFPEQEASVFYVWRKYIQQLNNVSYGDDTSFTPTLVNRYHPENIRKINQDILHKYCARNFVRFWEKAASNEGFSVMIPSLRCTIGERIRFFIHNELRGVYPDKAIKLNKYIKTIFSAFPNLFSNIFSLHLSSAKLSILPRIISIFKNITSLDLSNNRIFFIPEEIKELSNLRNLDFSSNRIKTIALEVFELYQLRRLALSDNQIKSIPKEIGNLTNLELLDLQANNITTIPEEIRNLINLELLDLYRNEITDIAESVSELFNLTHLNLAINNLSFFPSQVLRLRRLTILVLYGNKIADLPINIANLANLRCLNINNNYLEDENTISTIGNLLSLEELDLSNHNFEIIPASFMRLRNLLILDFSNNALTSIPGHLCNLTGLTRLFLEDNSIKQIPYEITNLYNLRTLNLARNSIESITQTVKDFFNYIPQIDISENPLAIGELK